MNQLANFHEVKLPVYGFSRERALTTSVWCWGRPGLGGD